MVHSEVIRLDKGTCIPAANLVLARAGLTHHVENVGRAALVLALDASSMDVDYTKFEERWREIRKGSSVSADDAFPFVIIANDVAAIEVRLNPETPTPLVDVLLEVDALWLGDPKRRVQLRKPGESCIIDGNEFPAITDAQFSVVGELLKLGGSATERELIKITGHQDVRGILRRLAGLPGWSAVIKLPGKAGGRYRILG